MANEGKDKIAQHKAVVDALNDLDAAWTELENLVVSLDKRGHKDIGRHVDTVIDPKTIGSRITVVGDLKKSLDLKTEGGDDRLRGAHEAVASKLKLLTDGIATLQADKPKWEAICKHRGVGGNSVIQSLKMAMNKIIMAFNKLGNAMGIYRTPKLFSTETRTVQNLAQVAEKARRVQVKIAAVTIETPKPSTK